MPISLPPASHDLAEVVPFGALKAIERGSYVPPTLQEAKALARQAFERSKGARIRPSRFFYLCLRADDQVDWISIGPRGGWKRHWRFGKFPLIGENA